MTVNPFVTGDQAVGVRTTNVAGSDSVGYTVEVWDPAPDRYRHVAAVDTFKFVDELPEATQEAIRDAEPADGRRPLIMYWHGGYGHRREMAALCVFFASHGFVVDRPDFPGITSGSCTARTRNQEQTHRCFRRGQRPSSGGGRRVFGFRRGRLYSLHR